MNNHIIILIYGMAALLLAACTNATLPEAVVSTEEPTEWLATETAVGATANADTTQPTPTVIAMATGVPTSTQGPTMTPPSVTRTPKPPTATAVPFVGSLKGQGPWLIYSRGYPYTMYSVSAVDRTISQLTGETVTGFGIRPGSTGASTQIATIEGEESLALTVRDAVAGTRQVITWLLPEGARNDPELSLLYDAIYYSGIAPVWSPDGSQLAFPGAMSGISTDLYIYTPATGAITQASSGDSNVGQISWSPDGQWVIYSAREDANQKVAVWVSRPDGSQNSLLYYGTPMEWTLGEMVIYGWLDANTPIFGFYNYHEGLSGVYAGDIAGETSTLLQSDVVGAAVASDGTMLFTTVRNGDQSSLVMLKNGQETRLTEADSRRPWRISWSPAAGLFIVHTGGSPFGVTTTGSIVDLPAPEEAPEMEPVVSPDGALWAWHGATGGDGIDPLWGLYVGAPTSPPPRVAYMGIDWVEWSPDSQYFAAWGASGNTYGLWISTAPEFTPVIIELEPVYLPVYWIMP